MVALRVQLELIVDAKGMGKVESYNRSLFAVRKEKSDEIGEVD